MYLRVSKALQGTSQTSSQTNSEPLKTLGFNTEDAALILDLIVYLAIENVAFYRFLDLDTCKALLSWVDYEYLDEKGSYQNRYRTAVENQCSTLETALKTFAAGLDQVLELHHGFDKNYKVLKSIEEF